MLVTQASPELSDLRETLRDLEGRRSEFRR